MKTIFIGGSRNVSRLPAEVRKRLDNVVASSHQVIVGDANGADKAVQKHLSDVHYDRVVVFCSGNSPRNNLASWHTEYISVPKAAKGFEFYAAKDREMAKEADFGLMIWDGRSPGTLLNVLRLVRGGKIAVLFNVPDKSALNIKSIEQWQELLSQCNPELIRDLKERATPDEWNGAKVESQPNFLTSIETSLQKAALVPEPPPMKAIVALNDALTSGDSVSIMGALGNLARERGMSKIARDTGLARESLYRSLDPHGNPEFATILKVMISLGLRLEAKRSKRRSVPA